ncbi:T9SS C-terminal target domain-containing protein [Flavobacteriaceae bacterium LYZ1037]|nr:T9SS C-terminal target domain-containing protein [Flavobacteriaceae bacterium LYZ1037]
MKQIYTLLILLLITFYTQAQIVTIPDTNFKNALISQGVDTNGDGEIQITEAETQINLAVYNAEISDLTGIEAFTNLQQFSCPYNEITTLNVSNNIALTHLQVFGNQLTNLDISSNSNLYLLNCMDNQISSLDLSNNLNLEQITLDNNLITNLNLTNNTLIRSVDARNNQINSISFNPNNAITHLTLPDNEITSIDLSYLNTLKYLDLDNNYLTNISLNNTSSLESLSIVNNQLENIDISSNSQLWYLDCSNNDLTSLNLSNNLELNYAKFQNNQINNLVCGSSSLWEMDCSNNQLTNIDVSGLTSLFDFNFSNNPELTTIIFKNGNNFNYSSSNIDNKFNQLPNLQTVCVDHINSIFTNLLQGELTQTITFTEFCSFTPGGEYYTITGDTLLDLDINGCDSSDLSYTNLLLQVTNGTETAAFYSNDSGLYTMPLQSGNYTITPQLENPSYFSVTPTSVSVNLPSSSNPYAQDFCIIPNGNYNNLEISIVPVEVARPGFDTDYKIIYKNKGTTTLSGNIDFIYDDDFMNLLTAEPLATIQTTGNLSWNYNNLLPFETREILISMTLNTPTDANFPLNGDDVLEYSVTINPSISDETPDDNTMNLNQIVVNSFDPNNKTCLQGQTVSLGQVGKYVHYLIRFENTGTANAVNVVVKDVIDSAKYDLFSLIPLDASHDFSTKIRNENEVEFIFENIQLPFEDATNDGYILFKIKTLPALIIGDSFSNKAEIHFDYNAPIITNDETTIIEENLSIKEYDLSSTIKIYPNPTSNYFEINNSKKHTINNIEIYDISGKFLKQFTKSEKYDIHDLSSGIYFIKIKSNKLELTKKIIKT